MNEPETRDIYMTATHRGIGGGDLKISKYGSFDAILLQRKLVMIRKCNAARRESRDHCLTFTLLLENSKRFRNGYQKFKGFDNMRIN